MHYAVTLERDEDGAVLVRFPDFPEARAVGDYEVDALVRARHVLSDALAACIKDRRPIPSPADRAGHQVVIVPILIEAKLCLYEAMRESGIGRAELARRLHWHRPQVDRLLNVRHASKLDQLETAAAVLGRRFTLAVEKTAAGHAPVRRMKPEPRRKRKPSRARSSRRLR